MYNIRNVRSPKKSRNLNPMQLAGVNRRLAKAIWPGVTCKSLLQQLTDLSKEFGISVGRGEITYLDGKWYVTHAGLLRVAINSRCCGIRSLLVHRQCDPLSHKWVFRAIVYKSHASKGFVGYGERRSVQRLPSRPWRGNAHCGNPRSQSCSAQSLRYRALLGRRARLVPEVERRCPPGRVQPVGTNGGSHHSGTQPRLRDQLCLLIRQYDLEPNLVKAYAAHFCGTETIKEASRDLVESFISHIAASAKEDRDGLICKLNSLSRPVEVQQ